MTILKAPTRKLSFLLSLPLCFLWRLWSEQSMLAVLLFPKEDAAFSSNNSISVIERINISTTPVLEEERNKTLAFEGIPSGRMKRNAVLLFFHIPKTGGTTIKSNLGSLPFWEYTYVVTKQDFWRKMVPRINALCSTPPPPEGRKTVFVEIHSYTLPLLSLDTKLRTWRKQATANGVDFFVFTILREPLSWYTSAFNFYFRSPRTSSMLPATEQSMVSVAQHNPHCTYLAYSWQYTKVAVPRQTKPSKQDCDAVLRCMYEHLDWVGTTDQHEETTDLLKHLLGLQADFEFPKQNVYNGFNGTLRVDMLTPRAIEHHRNVSTLDYELYKAAQNWRPRLIPT